MARKLNAAKISAKWVQNTGAAGQYYRDGIESVTVAPGQQAAAQAQVMLAKVTEAVTSGRWGRAVGAVSLQSWQESAKGKGAARFTQGATAAAPKMEAVFARTIGMIENAQAAITRIPRGGLPENLNRMNAFVTAMAAQGKKAGGAR